MRFILLSTLIATAFALPRENVEQAHALRGDALIKRDDEVLWSSDGAVFMLEAVHFDSPAGEEAEEEDLAGGVLEKRAARATKYPYNNPELKDRRVFEANMLKKHNAYRKKFGTPALKWDRDLASFAQKYINNCDYQHSSVKYNNPPWYAENIAAAWSSDVKYLENYTSDVPIKGWGPDEFELYKYNPRTPRSDSATGHFQNMVWRSYNTIGCAVAYCPKGLTGKNGVITKDPAVYWSCDFGVSNPNKYTNFTPEYNIPRPRSS